MHLVSHSDSVADIYSHHHGWLVGLLRRKLGNADNADDLAQDTYTRLLLSLIHI